MYEVAFFFFFFPLLTFMSWVAAQLLCYFFKPWEMKCLSKRKGDPFHLWCLSMHIYLKDLKGTCVMKKCDFWNFILILFSLRRTSSNGFSFVLYIYFFSLCLYTKWVALLLTFCYILVNINMKDWEKHPHLLKQQAEGLFIMCTSWSIPIWEISYTLLEMAND